MRPSLWCRPIQKGRPCSACRQAVRVPTREGACGEEIRDCVCLFERGCFVCVRPRSADTYAACKPALRGASLCAARECLCTAAACVQDLDVWSLSRLGGICLCSMRLCVCVCGVDHSDLPTKPNRAQSLPFLFFPLHHPPTLQSMRQEGILLHKQTPDPIGLVTKRRAALFAFRVRRRPCSASPRGSVEELWRRDLLPPAAAAAALSLPVHPSLLLRRRRSRSA